MNILQTKQGAQSQMGKLFFTMNAQGDIEVCQGEHTITIAAVQVAGTIRQLQAQTKRHADDAETS